MKHCACAMLLTWWYFLLQSEGEWDRRVLFEAFIVQCTCSFEWSYSYSLAFCEVHH
ncbi:hypothetical protein DPMN_179065 [Dreissena polymorpha]|uniref:Uncharacterized protein n=1 Tax=Dreissena polymorpha TaxID=45954 RepID=A0A9D4EGG0_DREPO|nr:hypothetical protein DPMN_179065 [Dreissena polymorpha]